VAGVPKYRFRSSLFRQQLRDGTGLGYETWNQLSTLTLTSSHNRVIHDMGEVLAGGEIRTRTSLGCEISQREWRPQA
jgi:hypothetical protein